MRRMLLGLAALVCLATTLASTAAAQRPQTRRGFWIGFGFGGGTLNWDCDGCTSQSEGGPTGFVRLGGTTSDKVLLGAEINAWSLDIGAAKITGGVTVFVVNWYPNAAGGLFLKGGVGGSAFVRETASGEATATSGALLLGVGYDIRVAENMSITPVLTLWGSGKSNEERNGAVVNTGLRQGAGTLQIGLTFH
jgi:hypothetical protein